MSTTIREKLQFIMVAGEVHNSNSSTAEAMALPWEKAEELHLNTVLTPVTWEMLEPAEGEFDYTAVDMLLEGARKHNKKLVLLWFGAWKNAQCYYAPAWVKTDLQRFARAEAELGKAKTNLEQYHGMGYTSLSYLCEETCRADARAFAALMRHLKEKDEQEKTVLMVQVENETGLQGAAREHSAAADRAYSEQAPAELIAWLKSNTEEMAEDVREAVAAAPMSGSWEEVFGPVAEEVFSAYYIASYVEKVAAAGAAEYALPMGVNCWLNRGQVPGQYPSGGPVARMMEVWQYCAPHIAVYEPDIYQKDFCGVCDEYVKRGNPLCIPETAPHSHVGPRLVYSVGHYHALCFAPFGYEDMGGDQEQGDIASMAMFGIDTSDPLLITPQNVTEYAFYAQAIQDMMPLLLEAYGTNRLQAVISEIPDKGMMQFGSFGFQVLLEHPFIRRKDGVCLALQTAEDEFYLLLNACAPVVLSMNPERPNVDFLSLEEGRFEDGKWHVVCRLNGDEAAKMMYDHPTLLRMKLFAY